MPLEQLFQISSSAFEKMTTDGFQDENERLAALQGTECAMAKVYSEGLFSKNETMEDTATSSIKFRYLPYYYAMMLLKCMDNSVRLDNLKRAKDQLTEFIHTCASLHLLHEDDWNMVQSEDEVLYYMNIIVMETQKENNGVTLISGRSCLRRKNGHER